MEMLSKSVSVEENAPSHFGMVRPRWTRGAVMVFPVKQGVVPPPGVAHIMDVRTGLPAASSWASTTFTWNQEPSGYPTRCSTPQDDDWMMAESPPRYCTSESFM